MLPLRPRRSRERPGGFSPGRTLFAILFLATLIGLIIKAFSRDRCLKDFNKYPVALVLTDNESACGRCSLHSTGLELLYDKVTEKEGHPEASFLLYKSEYDRIFTARRYHSTLTEEMKKARQRILEKTYHPRFFRRLKRRIRNLFSSVKDAILEAFNMAFGQMKTRYGQDAALKSQDKYLRRIGTEAISSAATSYDALLERQIGSKVVVEVTTPDKSKIFFTGVFKEYTARFLEIMDVETKEDFSIDYSLSGEKSESGLRLSFTEGRLAVSNDNPFSVHIRELIQKIPPVPGEQEGAEPKEVSREMHIELEPGERAELELSPEATSLSIKAFSQRICDIIFPRATAIVRHRSEFKEGLGLKDFLPKF
ncbi:MAG: hypothetical protein AMS15_02840 [Planctomycetes bacterium DG_23]|nr:MAG: hypothetical protein AMS15_02840 [Planctomycetes bacterium DG_23]